MAEAKKYFRRILTYGVDDKDVSRDHAEKLDNYLKYGYAGTNADVSKDRKDITPEYQLPYEIEVHHMNTTSWMRGHTTNVLTILCCSDEYTEEKDR